MKVWLWVSIISILLLCTKQNIGLPYALGSRPSTLCSPHFQSTLDLCEKTYKMEMWDFYVQNSYFTFWPSYHILIYSDQETVLQIWLIFWTLSFSFFPFFFPSTISKSVYFENPSLSDLGEKEQKNSFKNMIYFFWSIKHGFSFSLLTWGIIRTVGREKCQKEGMNSGWKKRGLPAQPLPWAWRNCFRSIS